LAGPRGGRRPLEVFAPREGIERVRLLPRASLPWADYASLREAALDRDLSLARGYADLFEGLAVGLRYAAALAETPERDVDGEVLVAALALGEHYVAGAGAGLPAFTLPADQHERGPRMADLDMTLESIC
jgi:hypothetical protein